MKKVYYIGFAFLALIFSIALATRLYNDSQDLKYLEYVNSLVVRGATDSQIKYVEKMYYSTGKIYYIDDLVKR